MKMFKTLLASIVLVTLSTLALAVPAQAADLNIDYTLTTASSSGLSPADDCSPWPGNYFYEAREIHVTQTGSYSLTSYPGSNGYSYVVLYSQPFDPANPDAGCLATSGGTTYNTATLDADTSYWVYLSTVVAGVVGTYQGTISGPGNIVFGAITTTSLSVNPASVTVGDSVALVAAVAGTSPTGTVDFFHGTDLIGSATVSAGEATLSYSPSTSGNQDLTARYNGDAANAVSVSEATTLTVNAVPHPTPQPTPTPKPALDTKSIQAPTPPVSVETAAR